MIDAKLRYEPENGEPIVWTETKELEIGPGVAPELIVIFEDVWEEGREFEEYDITAEVVQEAERGDE